MSLDGSFYGLINFQRASAATTVEAGAPTALFKIESIWEGDYDVTADGQRFLINSNVAGTRSLPFTVVLNWTEGLKR